MGEKKADSEFDDSDDDLIDLAVLQNQAKNMHQNDQPHMQGDKFSNTESIKPGTLKEMSSKNMVANYVSNLDNPNERKFLDEKM